MICSIFSRSSFFFTMSELTLLRRFFHLLRSCSKSKPRAPRASFHGSSARIEIEHTGCSAQLTVRLRGVRWRRKREKDTQKKKGQLLKVFYLCAAGSSRLTSPVYWGLSDLNAALLRHYFATALIRLTHTARLVIHVWITFYYYEFFQQVMDPRCF